MYQRTYYICFNNLVTSVSITPYIVWFNILSLLINCNNKVKYIYVWHVKPKRDSSSFHDIHTCWHSIVYLLEIGFPIVYSAPHTYIIRTQALCKHLLELNYLPIWTNVSKIYNVIFYQSTKIYVIVNDFNHSPRM